jgi:hypothetical protein
MKKAENTKAISSYTFGAVHHIAAHKPCMDQEMSTELLLKFKNVMDAAGVPFFLAFGTCLGAYRDKQFIHHDCDIDCGLLVKHRDEFVDLIDSLAFAEQGIFVLRQDGALLTFEYKGEFYLDVYTFTPERGNYYCGNYYILNNQLSDGYGTIEFLGVEFNVPKHIEEYLTNRYGEDWQTPIRGKNAGA